MKQIEILAPAGSYESMVAAMNAGCDAVYIGGSRFGARAYADNLTEENLLQAIDYAHIHNKKLYLTVNTLLKNQELEDYLYAYLLKLYERGLDAVIVQDLGVMSFIHKHFPELPIHASTQMTITMSKSLELLKKNGVTRVVTSRELSLEEIKAIRQETDLEIESFVHGALCYCYSGQCLMSSMLGGRSGNRGRCAQTCRMPYSFAKDGKIISQESEKYLLSPKDICTLELIPELLESGIDSFKIEGRMKRPEYTALAASLYRKYTDLYLKLGKRSYEEYLSKTKEEFNQDIRDLMELYNRGGSSQGYYKNYNGKNMMSSLRPNHSGVLVGKVASVKGNRARIQLSEMIHGQDVLEFRDQSGEAQYEYTVKDTMNKNQCTETNYKAGSKIQVGDSVYRTKNSILLERIGEQYLKKELKAPISGVFCAHVGQPMKFTLRYGNIEAGNKEVSIYGDLVEEAQKQPMTSEKIKEQLKKMNTTSYILTELEVEMDSDIFIPVGKLNEIRRDAVEALTTAFLGQFQRSGSVPAVQTFSGESTTRNMEGRQEYGITVHVGNRSQFGIALDIPEVDAVGLRLEDMELSQINTLAKEAVNHKKACYLILPSIFRKTTYDQYENAVKEGVLDLNNLDIRGFVIKNLEEYEFITRNVEIGNHTKEIILDYNLYIMNKETKAFWQENGIHHFTASVELNEQELKQLGCSDMDLMVYGYVPLMTSAQCVVKNTIGCTKVQGIYTLVDRYKKQFYVVNHCKHCYNTIYNGTAMSLLNQKKEIDRLGPNQIRLDFTIETEQEMKRILKEFVDVFRYNRETETKDWKDYTKGHFKRGIE